VLVCQKVLYFENSLCEKCRHRLGYLLLTTTLSALEPEGGDWKALSTPDTRLQHSRSFSSKTTRAAYIVGPQTERRLRPSVARSLPINVFGIAQHGQNPGHSGDIARLANKH
jgi:hypothetical protein